MKFSHKITLVFALFLMTTLGFFCFWVYHKGYEMRKIKLEEEFQADATRLTGTLDKSLYERFIDLKNITQDPVLRSPDSTPRQIAERLEDFRNNAKLYISISFFDMDNVRIADTSGLEIGTKTDQEALLRDALSGREYVMNLGFSPSLEGYVVRFARAVRDPKGALRGTVVSRISLSRFYEIFDEAPNTQNNLHRCIDLFDENRTLLFSVTNKKGIFKDRLEDVFEKTERVRQQQKGSGFLFNRIFQRTDILGFHTEPGYLDFKGNGWRVVVHASERAIFEPVYRIRDEVILFSLIALTLLIGMIALVAKELSKPLRRLKEALVKVGKGDFTASVGKIADDEFGEVAKALDEMLVQLREKTTSIDNLLGEVSERLKMEKRLTELNEQLETKAREENSHMEKIERSREILVSMLEDNDASRKALENSLMEVKQAHQMVIQAEKLSSIGQLAAGVAHEINNPLSFISSNLATLEKYVGKLTEILRAYDGLIGMVEREDASKIKERIAAIMDFQKKQGIDYVLSDIDNLIRESSEGAGRIKNIVLNLKTFSRKDEGVKTPSDINAILDGIINIIWNEIKYKAQLVKEYGDLPKIECNAQQVGQVFINLLMNAAQAIEGKGTITIATRAEGDLVSIEIADTGHGMNPDVRKHLFEPFFTTKEAGKGTGLGLSISYEIIKKHGGDIRVQSEPGKGTTFDISLPVHSPKNNKETVGT